MFKREGDKLTAVFEIGVGENRKSEWRDEAFSCGQAGIKERKSPAQENPGFF